MSSSASQNERLRAIHKELQRQLELALEDVEQAIAEAEETDEKGDATLQASRRQEPPEAAAREKIVLGPRARLVPAVAA